MREKQTMKGHGSMAEQSLLADGEEGVDGGTSINAKPEAGPWRREGEQSPLLPDSTEHMSEGDEPANSLLGEQTHSFSRRNWVAYWILGLTNNFVREVERGRERSRGGSGGGGGKKGRRERREVEEERGRERGRG